MSVDLEQLGAVLEKLDPPWMAATGPHLIYFRAELIAFVNVAPALIAEIRELRAGIRDREKCELVALAELDEMRAALCEACTAIESLLPTRTELVANVPQVDRWRAMVRQATK